MFSIGKSWEAYFFCVQKEKDVKDEQERNPCQPELFSEKSQLFYIDRASGSDCNHRSFSRNSHAGIVQCPCAGQGGEMPGKFITAGIGI